MSESFGPLNTKAVSSPFPISYSLEGDMNSDHLYILLHGFMEKASKMVRRMRPLLPQNSLVLAPNGPFPLPEKSPSGYKVRYAWYFFDNIKNEYLIDYEFPTTLLKNLVIELGLANKKVTIIGYSQGGYLAPFLSMKLPKMERIIGMACVFKENLFPQELSCPYIQIHSEDDKMVSYEGSKSHFDSLNEKDKNGTFVTLKSAGHLYNEQYQEALKKLI